MDFDIQTKQNTNIAYLLVLLIENCLLNIPDKDIRFAIKQNFNPILLRIKEIYKFVNKAILNINDFNDVKKSIVEIINLMVDVSNAGKLNEFMDSVNELYDNLIQ